MDLRPGGAEEGHSSLRIGCLDFCYRIWDVRVWLLVDEHFGRRREETMDTGTQPLKVGRRFSFLGWMDHDTKLLKCSNNCPFRARDEIEGRSHRHCCKDGSLEAESGISMSDHVPICGTFSLPDLD